MADLTHFDSEGAAHMVDVTEKSVTQRSAIAIGTILMGSEAFDALNTGTSKKGDVLGIARLAGIMAAKKTSDLIPLCHPLPLSKVAIDFEVDAVNFCVNIKATVKTTGQTGVEMEALTAVNIAALTIYDMLKAIDKGMRINDVQLIMKDGGKSGRYEAT